MTGKNGSNPVTVKQRLKRARSDLRDKLGEEGTSHAELKSSLEKFRVLSDAAAATSEAPSGSRLRVAVAFMTVAIILTAVLWYLPYSTIGANSVRASVVTSSITLVAGQEARYQPVLKPVAVSIMGSVRATADISGDSREMSDLVFADSTSTLSFFGLTIPAQTRVTLNQDVAELRVALFADSGISRATVNSAARPESDELNETEGWGPYPQPEAYFLELDNSGTLVMLQGALLEKKLVFRDVTQVEFETLKSVPGRPETVSDIGSAMLTFESIDIEHQIDDGEFLRFDDSVQFEEVEVTSGPHGLDVRLYGKAGRVIAGRRDSRKRIDPSVLDVFSKHGGLALFWGALFFLYGALWSIREITRGYLQ